MPIDFGPAQLDRNTFYKLLTATVVPRPIAWAATTSAAGTDNLAPATVTEKRCRQVWDVSCRTQVAAMRTPRFAGHGPAWGNEVVGGPRQPEAIRQKSVHSVRGQPRATANRTPADTETTAGSGAALGAGGGTSARIGRRWAVQRGEYDCETPASALTENVHRLGRG
jgi:hypothetical protein